MIAPEYSVNFKEKVAKVQQIIDKTLEQVDTLKELKRTFVFMEQKELYGERRMLFTQDEFNKFRKRHKEAVDTREEQFTYMKQEFLTAYAGYLIEYHLSLPGHRK